MFKKGLLSIEQAKAAIAAYEKIPIAFKDVSLFAAVALAHELGIYAYDAYMLSCAQQHSAPLLTLDRGLMVAANRKEIPCIEVTK
jgi:predicted nucleic acid-binding protein